jgi:hypothetical protein
VRALALPATVLLIVAGCGLGTRESESSSGSESELEIVVWASGKGGASTRRTLRCPGTTEADRNACRMLEGVEDAFEPVPADTVCSDIYGGPQVAEVRGTFNGREVNATFNRTNGCEIARWDRVQFLFPVSP